MYSTVWPAFIFWQIGKKLNLYFALSVMVEGSPCPYCSWIQLSTRTQWGAKRYRAAVAGQVVFGLLCRCSLNTHICTSFVFLDDSVQMLYISYFPWRFYLLICIFQRWSESSTKSFLGSASLDSPNICSVDVESWSGLPLESTKALLSSDSS